MSPRRGEAPLNLSQPSLHSFLILPSRGAYIYDRLLWFHFYFRCISYGLHMILWDSLLIPCDFLWISYDSKLISWDFHCISSEAFETCILNIHMRRMIWRCKTKIHIIFTFHNIHIQSFIVQDWWFCIDIHEMRTWALRSSLPTTPSSLQLTNLIMPRIYATSQDANRYV